jgi:hypothetical protein
VSNPGYCNAINTQLQPHAMQQCLGQSGRCAVGPTCTCRAAGYMHAPFTPVSALCAGHLTLCCSAFQLCGQFWGCLLLVLCHICLEVVCVCLGRGQCLAVVLQKTLQRMDLCSKCSWCRFQLPDGLRLKNLERLSSSTIAHAQDTREGTSAL